MQFTATFPSLSYIGGDFQFNNNARCSGLDLPALVYVGGGFGFNTNTAASFLKLPALNAVNASGGPGDSFSVTENQLLSDLGTGSFTYLEWSVRISENPLLESVKFGQLPLVVADFDASNNTGLTRVELGSVVHVNGSTAATLSFLSNPLLTSVQLQSLTSAKNASIVVHASPLMGTLDLPALQEADRISMTSVADGAGLKVPVLEVVGTQLQFHSKGGRVDAEKLSPTSDLSFTDKIDIKGGGGADALDDVTLAWPLAAQNKFAQFDDFEKAFGRQSIKLVILKSATHLITVKGAAGGVCSNPTQSGSVYATSYYRPTTSSRSYSYSEQTITASRGGVVTVHHPLIKGDVISLAPGEMGKSATGGGGGSFVSEVDGKGARSAAIVVAGGGSSCGRKVEYASYSTYANRQESSPPRFFAGQDGKVSVLTFIRTIVKLVCVDATDYHNNAATVVVVISVAVLVRRTPTCC